MKKISGLVSFCILLLSLNAHAQNANPKLAALFQKFDQKVIGTKNSSELKQLIDAQGELEQIENQKMRTVFSEIGTIPPATTPLEQEDIAFGNVPPAPEEKAPVTDVQSLIVGSLYRFLETRAFQEIQAELFKRIKIHICTKKHKILFTHLCSISEPTPLGGLKYLIERDLEDFPSHIIKFIKDGSDVACALKEASSLNKTETTQGRSKRVAAFIHFVRKTQACRTKKNKSVEEIILNLIEELPDSHHLAANYFKFLRGKPNTAHGIHLISDVSLARLKLKRIRVLITEARIAQDTQAREKKVGGDQQNVFRIGFGLLVDIPILSF